MVRLFVMAAVLIAIHAPEVGAQQLFRCGATYQDRPCENPEVQQRFSQVSGTSPVQQINPETSKACARLAAELHGYWQRMKAGEDIEVLRSEAAALPHWKDQRDVLRNQLLALREANAHSSRVRSELETSCMTQHRGGGAAAAAAARVPDWRESSRRADLAAARARLAAERAYLAARP